MISWISVTTKGTFLKYSNAIVLLENRRKSKLTFLQGRRRVCDSVEQFLQRADPWFFSSSGNSSLAVK